MLSLSEIDLKFVNNPNVILQDGIFVEVEEYVNSLLNSNAFYNYKCEIISVYDGDTMRGILDLGFGIDFKGIKGKGISLRLEGVDTPELRSKDSVDKEKAYKVRDYVRELVKESGNKAIVISKKVGKYGRYLSEVILLDNNNLYFSLNNRLKKLGYEKNY